MATTYHSTVIAKKFDQYSNQRMNIDLAVIFHLIKQFQPTKFLEFGFYEGKTLGVMIEAAPKNSTFVAVDLNFRFELFDRFYKSSPPLLEAVSIEFIQTNSATYTSDVKFDFINVDADHSYPAAFNDIMNASTLISKDGILMIDDYNMPGVDQSINEYLKIQTDWVPFMRTDQSLYMHHISQNASIFLDEFLEYKFGEIFMLFNTDYKGHSIKHISTLQVLMNDNDIF